MGKYWEYGRSTNKWLAPLSGFASLLLLACASGTNQTDVSSVSADARAPQEVQREVPHLEDSQPAESWKEIADTHGAKGGELTEHQQEDVQLEDNPGTWEVDLVEIFDMGQSSPDGQPDDASGDVFDLITHDIDDGACVPACDGMQCGDDGCGGTCGECDGTLAVCVNGACQCTPDCADKQCGDDGCGGTCGECDCCLKCSAIGQCDFCVPDCSGKECGTDGCFHDCGTCDDGFICQEGSCFVEPPGTEPKIQITNLPPQGCQSFAQQVPVTTLTVELEFENWSPDEVLDNAVACYLDGVLDGSTFDNAYVFGDVPFGLHRLCCVMLDAGEFPSCDRRSCACVRVLKPCSGGCDDGNPCSFDMCDESIDGGQCYHTIPPESPCCTSTFDCDCHFGGFWNLCSEGICGLKCAQFGCHDGDPCTIDECTFDGCVATYMPCQSPPGQ